MSGLRDKQRGADIFYSVINGKTLKQVAEMHKISIERVRQIFYRVRRLIVGMDREKYRKTDSEFAKYDEWYIKDVRKHKDHWNTQLTKLASKGFEIE